MSLIAGAKPAMRKRFRVGFGVAFVTAENIRAFDGDFASGAGRKQIALLVEDGDFDLGSASN